MEAVKLCYGDRVLELNLDGAKSVEILREKDMPVIPDLREAFLRAVTVDCVGSPPLDQLISGDDLVTIVISDITRFWMRQDKVVALLLEYLTQALGVPYGNIVILVALGTHRPQTDLELQALVTPGVYEKVRVLNHDCMAGDLRFVGTTSLGTQVYVNPLAVGRKVILTGGTVHHLMAGFGGGRKSVVPGIAGKATINQNHIHSLSPALPCSNPLIGVGKLPENPVNEDMDEACALVGPAFGINIVVNGHSEHCHLVCGHWQGAWEKSCQIVSDAMGVPIGYEADIVVVSCGGFPKDINLYQGVKSLLNASRAVREGGDMIFLAECREGGGAPEYFSWIESVKTGTLDADLRANFSIAGYIFYASCEASAKCNVHMLTGIPPETVADMKLHAYDNLDELLSRVDFTGKRVYVMPNGGNTVPSLKNNP